MGTNYSPSTADVAALLRARAVDGFGNKQPDFNDSTEPTKAQAQALIEEASDEVAEQIGTTVEERLVGPARRLTVLLAAANIELSYFPEQAAASNSMYDKLMARYTDRLAAYGTDSAEDAIATGPGNFPPPSTWGSRRW